ncbi:hypothetical protein KAR91_00230, partial [Candidatus Pacearchaeota archaeon]|nr:hypothetical protein [Candidatus Pacearchaeota archaeon]
TNEGFDYITGTVNDSGSFNVAWSPARNMIKQHGWMARTGLEKQLGKDVVFTKAEKNSNMVSKETGEDEIAESENIQVASLEQSIFKPYQFSFSSEITQTIINTIEGTTEVSGEDIPNFYGIVKFRKDSSQDWKYIWIRRLETEKDHSLGEWLGIEVNLDKVIPVEI